jgi:tetratricopeptide (TPR) repeat protein
LYHFKWLGDQHQGDSSALHNLALLYSDCKLPILSVENYKTALALGETLSAANLGFMYLDAGMTEQARTLVREAMQIEPHDGRVEACLAEIVQRPKDEAREEADLLDAAANEKEFLVTMGLALLRPVPRVDGLWTFPFGEMALRSSLKTVNGTADVARRATPPGLSALYGIVESKGSKEPIKTDRYTLTGKMEGAVCRFELSITNDSPPGWLGAVSSVLSGPNSRSGLIVFASDDKSATYAEIADDNIGKREELTKVHGQ